MSTLKQLIWKNTQYTIGVSLVSKVIWIHVHILCDINLAIELYYEYSFTIAKLHTINISTNIFWKCGGFALVTIEKLEVENQLESKRKFEFLRINIFSFKKMWNKGSCTGSLSKYSQTNKVNHSFSIKMLVFHWWW